jgi:hypothetical protein
LDATTLGVVAWDPRRHGDLLSVEDGVERKALHELFCASMLLDHALHRG